MLCILTFFFFFFFILVGAASQARANVRGGPPSPFAAAGPSRMILHPRTDAVEAYIKSLQDEIDYIEKTEGACRDLCKGALGYRSVGECIQLCLADISKLAKAAEPLTVQNHHVVLNLYVKSAKCSQERWFAYKKAKVQVNDFRASLRPPLDPIS